MSKFDLNEDLGYYHMCMANVLFPIEKGFEQDYAVMHIADFHFKEGFASRGNMRRSEWYFCVGGSADVVIGKKRHAFKAGMMFCNQANIYREIVCGPNQRMKAYMLGLEGTAVDTMMIQAMGGANRVFMPTNGEAILKVVGAMHDSASAYEPLAPEICRNYLPVLASVIKQGRRYEAMEKQDSYTLYSQCKQHIDQYHGGILHVDEVADYFNITHEYMCRLFKMHSHFTPYSYLLLVKMNAALNTLRTTEEPLKSIAFRYGFSSASAFSKAFKRVMGISPSFVREGD